MAAEKGSESSPSFDLQIRVASRKLIRASDHNLPPDAITVNNLDLLHNTYQLALVSFYPKPPTGDLASVAATFEAYLPAFLNHYFPFAGQIVANPDTGLPEVHCTNRGAELVTARAAVSLAQVDFHDLDRSVNSLQLPFADEIPLSVQVVAFACGGFSVSWAANHLVGDGYSVSMMASQWCEFVRTGGKLSALPIHDRSIFRPRAPPTYTSAVDDAVMTWPSNDGFINVLSSDVFVRVLYEVDEGSIRRLQGQASQEGRRATRMEAFSAYLWKVLAELVGDADETCRMAWWVNGRRKLGGGDPAALQSYVGNVVTCASAEARVEHVRHSWSLSRLAGVASDAIRAVANEAHFQELIDWVEGHKRRTRTLYRVELGLGSPAVAVNSLVNCPMDGDFGFGQPVLSMPALPWGRLGAALLQVMDGPNGSWLVGAFVWRKMAQALESDADGIVFKPVTADSLGLRHPKAQLINGLQY